MNRRAFLKYGLKSGTCLGLSLGLAAGGFTSPSLAALNVRPLPNARFDKLPRWRGFNLLEKFSGPNRPFREDDFRMIADFGFNFVRLPMDYRMWTQDNDWRKINEKVLEEIDEALRFGEKHGIHVCMNFHRAPGYTVAHPPETKSVWTDLEAQEVCRLHWTTFAKRYKGVSSDRLSFNLFNEPAIADDLLERCVAVHRMLIKAIRADDPQRLIICDGYGWGNNPFFDLVDDEVAQATRGYAPMEVSHYKANWVNSADFPTPTWPMQHWNGLIFSPGKGDVKEEIRKPLVIKGPFRNRTGLRIKVGTVSASADFVVLADGKSIFEHLFRPGPGEGEWKTVVHQPKWNVYQNIYDRDYETEIPAGTKTVEIRLRSGDWITLTEIEFRSGTGDGGAGKGLVAPMNTDWNAAPGTIQYHADGNNSATLSGGEAKDRTWLKKRMEPWLELQQQGAGVMVGEFGAFSPCPHEVALAWMEDMLANWKEAAWGYALWNFRGAFGIADSGRQDVDYEDYHGIKLDRKMLELLQKY